MCNLREQETRSWSLAVNENQCFAGAKGKPLGKQFLTVLEEHANKYGRIFRWQISGINIVSISDPADVVKLRTELQLQSPTLDYYREKRQKIPGVVFAYGPEWYT